MLQTQSILKGELTFAVQLALGMRTPVLRTILEFAEQEIVLPDGPRKGRRFQGRWHPAAKLFLAEIDKGIWSRVFFTGPNQDGKSLLLSIIICYLLFERGETVVFGVPSLDMAEDKWTVNLLPVINASRYKELLPTTGGGSRGGKSVTVEFRNGAILRFMTSGGDDASRAGFTSNNLAVTEADSFDEVGSASREGTKFKQLVKRTLAFPETARIFSECTVTTEDGLIWQEFINGTASRIALPCPHCAGWVTPEREHLVGWREADSETAAIASAQIACPACGVLWTNEQRVAANHRAVLVHRGQVVGPDGNVYGDLPPTKSFGFRWTAVNSILSPSRLPNVGGEEWKALRATDEGKAELDLLQSQWVRPIKPVQQDVHGFDEDSIVRRTIKGLAQGICPDDTECVTIAADVGQRLSYWNAVAWRTGGGPHVIAFDVIEVPSDIMAIEEAILLAFRDWRDAVATRQWTVRNGTIAASVVCIDARWPGSTNAIFQFCRESGEWYYPTQGYGATQRRVRRQKTKLIEAGDHYDLVESLATGDQFIDVNSDHWKSFMAARMVTPLDRHGAMTVFDPTVGLVDRAAVQRELLRLRTYAKHLTAERQRYKFDPRLGNVLQWHQVRENNHWGDAFELACVAAHKAGVRLLESMPGEQPPAVQAGAAPQRSFVNSYKGMY
ncbi:MAG TPA: terminase gpA endonuclease subunit [Tepidisphaeraceae bacterium]|jgi:phage terminase large subunit GpA-like protein|nr:terminase gpA endonuclease subunit [Tepidisphaeraceae bacterium]